MVTESVANEIANIGCVAGLVWVAGTAGGAGHFPANREVRGHPGRVAGVEAQQVEDVSEQLHQRVTGGPPALVQQARGGNHA